MSLNAPVVLVSIHNSSERSLCDDPRFDKDVFEAAVHKAFSNHRQKGHSCVKVSQVNYKTPKKIIIGPSYLLNFTVNGLVENQHHAVKLQTITKIRAPVRDLFDRGEFGWWMLNNRQIVHS